MPLGSHLKQVREERQLSLRDVEKLAKESKVGSDISSGYLSMLERDEVKQPSPRVLFTLASIYEVDYIELMKQANYIPNETKVGAGARAGVAFRGASQLSADQRRLIQRMIDFELSESQRGKRRRE